MENPKYISSLSEYLQAIEALKFHYPNAPLVQNPTSNPFLFRGLSNVSYSLLPGILRGHKQKFEDHIAVDTCHKPSPMAGVCTALWCADKIIGLDKQSFSCVVLCLPQRS